MNMEIALRAMVNDSMEIEKLSNLLARFNSFDVLRLQEMEIRHSNVLAWLLDSRELISLADLQSQKLKSLADHIDLWVTEFIHSEEFLRMAKVVQGILEKNQD